MVIVGHLLGVAEVALTVVMKEGSRVGTKVVEGRADGVKEG